MKIVKVIHGYPMRYNAGSEVYSQTLCHGLASRNHLVHVFTREEDPFKPDGTMTRERDIDDSRIQLHVVNNSRHRDRYRLDVIDLRFAELLDEVRPDIVHIGHLNHLSTSLVFQASRRRIPVIYTLHDYWLMCPRGQFMQMHSPDTNLWAACEGQDDHKCAVHCYARYFSGAPEEEELDIEYWTHWVRRRMRHIREVAEHINLFIAPANYLKKRFVTDFGLNPNKIVYQDYGFDRTRLNNRSRKRGEPFTFGYIGTHIPAKGVHLLIEAFGQVREAAVLRIWGRDRGQDTAALRKLAQNQVKGAGERIQWMGEYKNQHITGEVFNHIDAIVVPSVWVENSPLVIHEAQQAGVPVIAADTGGMAEYVHHQVNGLLFTHRSADSLCHQMQRLISEPDWAKQLGLRGYLYSTDCQIPNIDEHIIQMEEIYRRFVG